MLNALLHFSAPQSNTPHFDSHSLTCSSHEQSIDTGSISSPAALSTISWRWFWRSLVSPKSHDLFLAFFGLYHYMWHSSLTLILPLVSMNPFLWVSFCPSHQNSGVVCLNHISLVLCLLPSSNCWQWWTFRILPGVFQQVFYSLAWLHLTSTEEPQSASSLLSFVLLCPMDYQPFLLRYSKISSYSTSKITSPSPAKDIFHSSWILYIYQ